MASPAPSFAHGTNAATVSGKVVLLILGLASAIAGAATPGRTTRAPNSTRQNHRLPVEPLWRAGGEGSPRSKEALWDLPTPCMATPRRPGCLSSFFSAQLEGARA